jgi:hypothetical protein
LWLSLDVAKIAALGTWRYSQGIYRFDEKVYEAIKQTSLKGNFPSEVLYSLSEWCVYIETPNMYWEDKIFFGFWCHLEWDDNTERHELRLLLNTENLLSIPLHIGPWTVEEAILKVVEEGYKNTSLSFSKYREEDIQVLKSILSLILYVCSDEPEIDDELQPNTHPHRPQEKRTKRGYRLFPPDKPRIWMVGKTLGQQLRLLPDANKDKRMITPHLRRAHWHGFWVGPKNGDRRFSYKWLPPLLIAGVSQEPKENSV